MRNRRRGRNRALLQQCKQRSDNEKKHFIIKHNNIRNLSSTGNSKINNLKENININTIRFTILGVYTRNKEESVVINETFKKYITDMGEQGKLHYQGILMQEPKTTTIIL